jgi:hypothetical protein
MQIGLKPEKASVRIIMYDSFYSLLFEQIRINDGLLGPKNRLKIIGKDV